MGRSVAWVAAANSRIAPMTSAESGDRGRHRDRRRGHPEHPGATRAALVVGSLLGLGLALMLAIGLARRITRPLRRLTVAAGEIGAELPHMVERMQTPGEGPGVVVEPIPVESGDEIGRLAEAFNTVNDVTVQVAQEQAALRAEHRRDVRQRRPAQPGAARPPARRSWTRWRPARRTPTSSSSLFKLDHLATRMRRNAESLLVLAGIDSTRRLRRTLPLSDVIRTAVGEIEAFDRIDLSMSEDPEVSGRHALTVAHLLAELLENATHFSNPETRVVVSASVTGHGVDVTVTDYGLGMSEDEVADANEQDRPPAGRRDRGLAAAGPVRGRPAGRPARGDRRAAPRPGRRAPWSPSALPTTVFEGMAAPEPVEEVVTPVFEPAEDAEVEVEVEVDDRTGRGRAVPAGRVAAAGRGR